MPQASLIEVVDEEFDTPEPVFLPLLATVGEVVRFLLWLILLVVCWPLALLALILYPLVWLIMLPFRLIGITATGLFSLLKSVFMLPARLLRGPSAVRRPVARV